MSPKGPTKRELLKGLGISTAAMVTSMLVNIVVETQTALAIEDTSQDRFELTGKWKNPPAAGYHSPGIFTIEQDGARIVIYTDNGTKYISQGSKIIKAEIDGSEVKGIYNARPWGWTNTKGTISEDSRTLIFITKGSFFKLEKIE